MRVGVMCVWESVSVHVCAWLFLPECMFLSSLLALQGVFFKVYCYLNNPAMDTDLQLAVEGVFFKACSGKCFCKVCCERCVIEGLL